MDFRKIEYFLKVADTMNISRAAEELHISHQGLSKQIRLLEQELDVPLLERTFSGIALTETGKKLNEWFRPIANEANYRYKKLQDFVYQKKTTINLGYFNALSYRQCVKPVTQLLAGLQQNLKIDVLATDIGQVRKFLYEDMIDLAVTVMISEDDWQDVTYHVLYEFPLQIIVSEKHPWYQRDSLTPSDLEESVLLYYADGSPSFLKNIKVKERIPEYNFDSYMGRLDGGHEFGVIADIYSKREGNFRLLDLPEQYRSCAGVVATYRKEHPLRNLFQYLEDLREE